ncbi:MAG TPA: prepilin peptidase [Vicinamibacteria bacterium]
MRIFITSPLFEVGSFLLGLVVGSFANVCIHRLPLGLSVVHPPSRCPSCEALIAPRDNVPLLGWLWLRGRCRSCRAPISARYPAVELLNGLLYLGLASVGGAMLGTAVAMALATVLVILALIDLDHQILPDMITLPALVAGLLFGVLRQPAPVADRWLAALGGLAAILVVGMLASFDRRRDEHARGPDAAMVAMLLGFAGWHQLVLGAPSRPALVAAAGYLLMAGVAAAAYWYYGQEALGQGDWKMVAMLGAFLGGQGTLLAVFLGTLAGASTGLALLAVGRGSRRMKIPLGTFLAVGALAVLLAGEPLLRWYLGLQRA